MAQSVAIGAAREHRRFALAVLAAADVLMMLDGMVVAVALPAIQRDLGFSAAGLQWVLTAYTLALGSFLLVGGRAADVFGRRRLLIAGMVVFTAGSLAAGLAPTAAALLAARAVQGLGVAFAVPAAMALLAAAFREGPDTLYMQRELGLSALETGLAFLPLAASAGAGGLGAPRLIERFGAHRVATTCLLGTAACFAALAQVEGLAGVLAVFAVAGFTFAGAFVPLGGFGLAGVREKGLASGLFQTSTHLGGAIALALLATVAAAGGFGAGCLAAAGLTLLGACAAGVLLVR